MTRLSLATQVWIGVLLAAVYFATGKFGLMLAVVHPNASAVWAPSGVALAAVLALGYRAWPSIFAAAFLLNVTTAGSVATSLGIATGNTLEALVGSYLVTRFARGQAAFDRAADVFRFAALAALASTMVSATFGVGSLTLGGYAAPAAFRHIWLTWWLGDASGILMVTPLVLLWSADLRIRWSRAQWFEAAGSMLALVLTGVVVFCGRVPAVERLAFLCLPVPLWVAFRFGRREAAAATFFLSEIALAGTLLGFGPYAGLSLNASLLSLGTFMVVTAVMSLAIAAAVFERKRAEEDRLAEAAERKRAYDSLAKADALHRAIADLTSDFAVILAVRSDGAVVPESITEGFGRVTGYTADELAARGWRSIIDPEDDSVVSEAIGKLLGGERITFEFRIRPKEGGTRRLRCSAQPSWDSERSEVVHILAAAEDVTVRRQTEETVRQHERVIRELSTPVLRIRARLLIVPLIGRVDAERAQQLADQLLKRVRSDRARAVVMDMTGVASMDPAVASHLLRIVETCRLLGAAIIVTGLSGQMSDALVRAEGDLRRLTTRGDLQSGIEEAERVLDGDGRAASRR